MTAEKFFSEGCIYTVFGLVFAVIMGLCSLSGYVDRQNPYRDTALIKQGNQVWRGKIVNISREGHLFHDDRTLIFTDVLTEKKVIIQPPYTIIYE